MVDIEKIHSLKDSKIVKTLETIMCFKPFYSRKGSKEIPDYIKQY